MLEGQTRNDKKDIGRPYAVENPLNVSEASAQGTVKYGENRQRALLSSLRFASFLSVREVLSHSSPF